MSNNKTIVIDARVVVSNQSHGIARHTDELLLRLFRMETDLHFILLVTKDSPYLKMDLPRNFSLKMMRSGWISLFGQFELAYVLFKLKPALYHSPSFLVSLLSNVPFVATIHDLIHITMAKDYTFFHVLYYRLFLAHKIRQAKLVFTVSEFSKDEIVRYYGLSPDRIKVIYNGINPRFSRDQLNLSPTAGAAFREKYELPENFILSVGNKKHHKNIPRLVEAWCRGGFTEDLVLLSDFDVELVHLAGRYNKRHKLYFLRFVGEDELPLLYSLANAFVLPSLYEGFGLPPLEAAACSVPVVVSNRSSLPEIMKDAGIYVDPMDVDDIAKGIRFALAQDNPEVKAKVMRGREIALTYSWDRMAHESLALYRQLVGQLS